jgi:hypothetical protein
VIVASELSTYVDKQRHLIDKNNCVMVEKDMKPKIDKLGIRGADRRD